MRTHTNEVLQAKMAALQEEYDGLQYTISMAQGQIDDAKARRLVLKAERDKIIAEVQADPVVP